MPFHPTAPPNTSPSGRSINPGTARIGSMPGGSDYLAGLGPAPAGLSAADMLAPAPIIHPRGLPGPINSDVSKLIRSAAPHGFGTMFNFWNALGYKPPTAASPLNQWYHNGLWGAGGAGNAYNPGGVNNIVPTTDPINAAIQSATQTPFVPTGSTNPGVNAALMQNNARTAAPSVAAPATAPAPYTPSSPSGASTPGITWGGSQIPYNLFWKP